MRILLIFIAFLLCSCNWGGKPIPKPDDPQKKTGDGSASPPSPPQTPPAPITLPPKDKGPVRAPTPDKPDSPISGVPPEESKADNACEIKPWNFPEIKPDAIINSFDKSESFTGTLIAHSKIGFSEAEETTSYFLKTTSKLIPLKNAKHLSGLLGQKIRINAVKSSGSLLVRDYQAIQKLGRPPVLGEQKIGALIIDFTDTENKNVTPEKIMHAFDNYVAPYFDETSYGKVSLNTRVIGRVSVPFSTDDCRYTSKIGDAARAAAKEAGLDMEGLDRTIFFIPRSQKCAGWAGYGEVGMKPSSTWINGFEEPYYYKVLSHELGHNFGLWHAAALECKDSVLNTTNCTLMEYGDRTDTMASGNMTHYNAYEKERTGWISPEGPQELKTITESGIYELDGVAFNRPGIKALKIKSPRFTDQDVYFYVEYRPPFGFDKNLPTPYPTNFSKGLLVHLNGTWGESVLLNMTPSDTRWSNPAVLKGKAFHDWWSGVRIDLVASDEQRALVSVKINSPADAAPGLCF